MHKNIIYLGNAICAYELRYVIALQVSNLGRSLTSSFAKWKFMLYARFVVVWRVQNSLTVQHLNKTNGDDVLTSWSKSAQQRKILMKRAHFLTRQKLIRRTCAQPWTASRTEIGEQLLSARPVCVTPNIVAHLNSTTCKRVRRCVQYSGIRHFHIYVRYRAL